GGGAGGRRRGRRGRRVHRSDRPGRSPRRRGRHAAAKPLAAAGRDGGPAAPRPDPAPDGGAATQVGVQFDNVHAESIRIGPITNIGTLVGQIYPELSDYAYDFS